MHLCLSKSQCFAMRGLFPGIFWSELQTDQFWSWAAFARSKKFKSRSNKLRVLMLTIQAARRPEARCLGLLLASSGLKSFGTITLSSVRGSLKPGASIVSVSEISQGQKFTWLEAKARLGPLSRLSMCWGCLRITQSLDRNWLWILTSWRILRP